MNVFIRRGYIDEEYYDYISYFYPDMVSQNDRDLLLAMKQTIKEIIKPILIKSKILPRRFHCMYSIMIAF